jgi:hypothetical protein
MKSIALLVVIALSTTACASMSKGGARGPVIQRTTDDAAQKADPATDGSIDGRVELGQR